MLRIILINTCTISIIASLAFYIIGSNTNNIQYLYISLLLLISSAILLASSQLFENIKSINNTLNRRIK